MTEQHEDFNSIQQDLPAQLSAKELQAKRFQPRSYNNKKKTPLREQVSKPPKTSVKLRPKSIPIHFKWALILTIFCFFLIGPCWALYRISKLRRLIQQQEFDQAERLSNKMQTVLIFSTIIGIFVWIAILFCSVGIIIAGDLLKTGAVVTNP